MEKIKAAEIGNTKNWNNKKLFLTACFVDDLQTFYKKMILDNNGRINQFEGNLSLNNFQQRNNIEHKLWFPSTICCETGELLTQENIDIKIGYWMNIWKPIRKDLKEEAMKKEAFECQKIDCSCNDCKFLDREKSWCNKLDKKTSIDVNLCHPQNLNCFEHRKS